MAERRSASEEKQYQAYSYQYQAYSYESAFSESGYSVGTKESPKPGKKDLNPAELAAPEVASPAAADAVAAPATAMAIDYIGQVRPFEALRWSTWLSGACGAVQATFHFRLHVIEDGAARLT